MESGDEAATVSGPGGRRCGPGGGGRGDGVVVHADAGAGAGPLADGGRGPLRRRPAACAQLCDPGPQSPQSSAVDRRRAHVRRGDAEGRYRADAAPYRSLQPPDHHRPGLLSGTDDDGGGRAGRRRDTGPVPGRRGPRAADDRPGRGGAVRSAGDGPARSPVRPCAGSTVEQGALRHGATGRARHAGAGAGGRHRPAAGAQAGKRCRPFENV